MDTYELKRVAALPVTPDLFQPYGQMITAIEDGQPYGDQDAQLELQNGIPRFYIMRLHNRGRKFHKITRHRRCTQCIGALAGQEWFIGVAPPGDAPKPDREQIRIFRIPGNSFIKLAVGTWHAGPLFDAPSIDFYNLELSDTNIVDHDTCNLLEHYGVEFQILLPEEVQNFQ